MTERKLPRGLAENLAHFVARDLHLEVPIDLHVLAGALGVTRIRETSMVEDGRTSWHSGTPSIELRQDRPQARKRFTLAHEIAHVLIEANPTIAHRTLGLVDDNLETLCDQVAAALLLPRTWITRYTNRDKFNLSLLRLIAHRADVSLAAAAVRLAEVSGRTCILLRLQRAPTRWVVVGHAAVPIDLHGRLEVTPESSQMFDDLPGGRDCWRELTLDSPRGTIQSHAHVDRTGHTSLALITTFGEF